MHPSADVLAVTSMHLLHGRMQIVLGVRAGRSVVDMSKRWLERGCNQ